MPVTQFSRRRHSGLELSFAPRLSRSASESALDISAGEWTTSFTPDPLLGEPAQAHFSSLHWQDTQERRPKTCCAQDPEEPTRVGIKPGSVNPRSHGRGCEPEEESITVDVHGRVLWDFESAHIDFNCMSEQDIRNFVDKVYTVVHRAVIRTARYRGFDLEALSEAIYKKMRTHVTITAFMRDKDYDLLGPNREILRACGVHVFSEKNQHKSKEVVDCVIRNKVIAISTFKDEESHDQFYKGNGKVLNIPVCCIIANDHHYLDALASFYKAHPAFQAVPVTAMIHSTSFGRRGGFQEHKERVRGVFCADIRDYFLRWSGPLDKTTYQWNISAPIRQGGDSIGAGNGAVNHFPQATGGMGWSRQAGEERTGALSTPSDSFTGPQLGIAQHLPAARASMAPQLMTYTTSYTWQKSLPDPRASGAGGAWGFPPNSVARSGPSGPTILLNHPFPTWDWGTR